MTERTPTPWALDPDDRDGYEWNIFIVTEANRDLRVAFMTSGPEAEPNAAFIVKVANAHADLVSALAGLLKANDGVQDVLCDGPEVPGFDPSALGRAQGLVTEAENVARAVLAKVQS